MTKDVIELAREAGLIRKDRTPREASMIPIGNFAALVAARERERCAQVCESRQTPGTGSVAILNGAADAIRALNTEGEVLDATTAQKGGA